MKSKKNIIWLDDDLKYMKSAESLFNDYGFQIIKCTSIATALKAINDNKSNFLLLDVNFPNSKKEGLIFLEQIRITHPDLKVVIFTGYKDTDDAVTAIRDLYALDYIGKPIIQSKEDANDFFYRLNTYFKSKTTLSNKSKTKWYKRIEIIVALIGAAATIAAAIITPLLSRDTKGTQENIIPKQSKDSSTKKTDSVSSFVH